MHKIAVIPGDGTGPEVVREGLKVLEAAASKFGFRYETEHYDFGGDATCARARPLPDSAVEELRGFDAIYLGAIGHPDVKPGILEKGILLSSASSSTSTSTSARSSCIPGVETPLKDKGPERHRLRRRPRKHRGPLRRRRRLPEEGHARRSRHARVHQHPQRGRALPPLRLRVRAQAQQGEKAHPLRQDQRAHLRPRPLGARVPGGRRSEYPDIEPDYNHVDACFMWMVKNPECFDVIVTDNMFGDIITDLGAHDPRRHGRRRRRQHQPRGRRACSSRWAARRPSTPAKT